MTEIMLQTVLEEDELYYLLATVAAKRVWGLDNTRLFPQMALAPDADPIIVASREARLANGLALLKAHGWILPAAHDTWDINGGLVQMVATIADPEIVLTTTYFLAPTTKALLAYYLAHPLIVEVAQLEDATYRVASLPSLPFLLTRMGQTLDLPANGVIVNAQPLFVAPDVFRDAAKHRHGAGVKGRVGADEATALAQLLADAHLRAEIGLARTTGDELLTQITLTLFAAKGMIWMAHETEVNLIRLEPLTMTVFSDTITSAVQQLLQIRPEKR
jgi:hypothetical protein